jgi:uncharacterized repeat protein (TIGR01451 family)
MKRSFAIGIGLAAALAIVPFDGVPLVARAFDAGKTMAENIANRPKVEIALSAEKQLVSTDDKGKQQISWQALEAGNAVVQPGDVLRYTANSSNQGNVDAKNLVVTQPIPKGTMFVLNSAKTDAAVVTTYSIDNGETFTEKPMVQVTLPNGKTEMRPAPAEAYTHVRWQISSPIAPKAGVKLAYNVKVQ